MRNYSMVYNYEWLVLRLIFLRQNKPEIAKN